MHYLPVYLKMIVVGQWVNKMYKRLLAAWMLLKSCKFMLSQILHSSHDLTQITCYLFIS